MERETQFSTGGNIGYCRLAVRPHQDVARRQRSVEHADGVSVVHGLGHLTEKAQHGAAVQRARRLPTQPVRQVLPVHQVTDQQQPPRAKANRFGGRVCLPDLVQMTQRHDPAMTEVSRGYKGFTQTHGLGAVPPERRRQHFHGQMTSGHGVFGGVNQGLRSMPDEAQQAQVINPTKGTFRGPRGQVRRTGRVRHAQHSRRRQQ